MNQYISAKQEELAGPVEHFRKEIGSLRTGRANSNILSDVQVDAYGARTPLNAVGNITVPDAESIIITPWDKNILKDIEKSLNEAELGLGIVNEGDKIRLTVPKMTEENRKDLVKKLNEKQEEARIAVRQVRDDIKSDIEEAEKNKEVTEDDKFRFLKELDEEIQKRNDEIKAVRDRKEEEIMKV
jgi:ribosome recycling factor